MGYRTQSPLMLALRAVLPCKSSVKTTKRQKVLMAGGAAAESVPTGGNRWLGLGGKSAIVTGGASGLGKAISLELVRQHVSVCVWKWWGCDASCAGRSNPFLSPRSAIIDARPDEAGWTVVEEIQGKVRAEQGECKAKVVYLRGDVADAAGIAAVVNRVSKEIGGAPDICVCNAGINIPGLLHDPQGKVQMDGKSLSTVFAVNVFGVVNTAQAAVHLMLQHKKPGVVINISSECAERGSTGQGAYAASKAAVESLTHTWAKELGPAGVRFVSVAPGILEATGLRTAEYEQALAYARGKSVEELRASYCSSIPLHREARLTEIANVVVFLASERSSYVTGTGVNIAGGK
jgi:sorbitol-6-phosphate 2-dehydrogenase